MTQIEKEMYLEGLAILEELKDDIDLPDEYTVEELADCD